MKYLLFNKFQRSLIKFSVTLAISLGIDHLIPVFNFNQNLQAIASETTETLSESQQLLGQWKIISTLADSDSFIFLFAPNGNLYLINSTKQTAVKGEYQVNSNNGQVYLDVFQGSFGARTSFIIDAKGKLVIQQLFMPAITQLMYSGSMNDPSIVGGIFMPNLLSLTKISSDTKLDPKLDFTPPQSPAMRARQSEAKTYVGTMNRGQQAVFLETGKFASSIAELALGIRDESESYKYQIIVLDAKKAVQQIALPKNNDLKSYIGLVYIKNSTNNASEPTISGLLCESVKPTKAPPPKFTITATPTCPEGYINIGS